MSTFNEADHPRHGDGRWAAKELEEVDPGFGECADVGVAQFDPELLAWLSDYGVTVDQDDYMEGGGFTIRTYKRASASITPRDGQWVLGAKDMTLDYRSVPRTIGVYDSASDALEAYANGAR